MRVERGAGDDLMVVEYEEEVGVVEVGEELLIKECRKAVFEEPKRGL